jgi:hypothetical protein
VGHATELMRISYLRYALKTASDPHQFLKKERESLHSSPQFISMLEILSPWPR